MSVIIDEFELVIEPPPSPPPQQATTSAAPEKKRPLKPEEIIRIQQRHRARLLRVWAD